MARIRLREVALSCSIIMMAAGSSITSAAPTTAAASPDISGLWWVLDYDPKLRPMDGSPVPYTPEGKAEHDKNIAAIAARTFVDPPLTTCLLPGLPRAMISAYPMKIVQHDRSVTFIHEQTHAFWHAIIGIPHRKIDEIDTAFMGGESVATWEGDTMIVDSIAFKPNTYLDETGMPHGDDLRVTQRLRKIDSGRKLESIMTIEDPAMFTKPWTARRTYEFRPDVKIMEYVCGDPKRPLTGDRARTVPLRRSK